MHYHDRCGVWDWHGLLWPASVDTEVCHGVIFLCSRTFLAPNELQAQCAATLLMLFPLFVSIFQTLDSYH